MMSKENRRSFLTSSTGAALSLSVLGRSSAWAGANETVRVACVGIKGRGWDHIEGFSKAANSQVVALCDVDENILNEQANRYGKPVKKFTDVRELLQDKEIDAISIATPNHWHSLIGIWACQAGKDVYVEKPCSHNIYEGRKLVEAARKYNRIVQHGTQSRASKALKEAIQLLRDGYIGEVYYAKGICYKWRDTIGHKEDGPVPSGVHYDTWLGPAPTRPFNPNRFHYNWHWNWDYGNGDIGNQGVHEMDVARWGLGVGLPDTAVASGGHFMFKDDQETPNTLVSAFKYEKENKMLEFEVRHWMTNEELQDRSTIGILFLGSKGIMSVPSYNSYKIFLGRERKPDKTGSSGGNHFQNFIDCVRSRKREDLNAEIEEGHLSAALCHLANAAYRVQRTLRIDRQKEICINDDEANAILHGTYRNPFVVPDPV